MNVNKKLDRFKQWAGERMGGEVKTNVSDDFKALEVEMALRHEGMYSQSSQCQRLPGPAANGLQAWSVCKSP